MQIDAARKDLETAEKGFEARRMAWASSTDEESFNELMISYQNMKEDALADLILVRRGEEGDLFIVRVLRAFSLENPRKAGKLVTAIKDHELGGAVRWREIQELWLAGAVSEAERQAAEAALK